MIIDKTPEKKAKTNGGYIAIPKVVFSSAYNTVSAEAKLLYGILLDRTSLSERKPEDWRTKDGEIFVYYPLTQISEILGCGHDKATRLLRELSDAGLILRIRQGLGRPDQIVVKTALQNSANEHSTLRKSTELGCDSSAPNNLNIINPESINPDQPLSLNRKALEAMIREKISYEILISQIEVSFVKTAVTVMVDAIRNPSPSVQIAGISRTKDEIYRRLMGLNDMHVRYAFDRFKATTKEIQYPQAYVLARLYNAPDEMDIYYESKVAADERRASGVIL